MALSNWLDIKVKYKRATLILGNGFSIGIHDKFKYKSLWDEAKKEPTCGETREYLTEDLCSLAAKLKTGTNFELLLRQLYTAKIVNEKFELETEKIEKNYAALRTALIDTIKEIHCEYSAVEDDLKTRIAFLKQFNTVFSLSYDLLVYWIINLNNRIEDDLFENAKLEHYDKQKTLKDCWGENGFSYDNWELYRIRYKKNPKENSRTLVFFPHGALHLVQTENGVVKKVKRTEDSCLLTQITNTWLNNRKKRHPLFVAEGDHNEKLRAIQSNAYLNTVYQQILPKSIKDDCNLVIFGWAMKRLDQHLIKKIASSEPKNIAIGIHHQTENKQAEIVRIKNRLKKQFVKFEKEAPNIEFFEIGEDFFEQKNV